ncbi:hypothetical protein [Sediminibacterium sp.]|uniref:hypothetical protein n=1 Tax=Sediminibacterium sp. TaxID=1917865 RepID=UPI003F71E348
MITPFIGDVFEEEHNSRLEHFLESNSEMQQFFVSSGSYDDDDGDRYSGTQWYNR